MARFRLSHLLLWEKYALKTPLTVREVLERVYMKIGKPRPYALATMLAYKGTKTFDGSVSKDVVGDGSYSSKSYREVKVSGTVKTVKDGTVVQLRIGSEPFSTVAIIAGGILMTLFGIWGIYRNLQDELGHLEPYFWTFGGSTSYLFAFLYFRSKCRWAKRFLANLLEGTEYQ